MDIITMTCRMCGEKLKITQDAEQIICQHCGREYLIIRDEGTISIKPLSEGIQRIQDTSAKTASELALVRIKEEFNDIYQWNQAAHYYCQHYMEIANISIKGGYSSAPNPWLKLLKATLKGEESKWFKDPEKNFKIRKLIDQGEYCVGRWDKLVEQEIYHRKIVDQL